MATPGCTIDETLLFMAWFFMMFVYVCATVGGGPIWLTTSNVQSLDKSWDGTNHG